MLSRDPPREDCFPAILQVADRQYFAIRLRRRRRHAKRTGTGLRPTERQAAAAGSRPGDSGPDSSRRIVSVPHDYTGKSIPRASGRAKKPYLLETADFPSPAGPAAAGQLTLAGPPRAYVSCASLEHCINTACRASRWSSPLHRGVDEICLSYRGRNARFQVVLACFPGIRRGKIASPPSCKLRIDNILLSGSVGEGGMRNGRELACDRQKGRPRPPGAGRAIPGRIPAGE